MSSNFLGLGFLLSAKDDGLEDSIEKINDGFLTMSERGLKLQSDLKPAVAGIKELFDEHPLQQFLESMDEDRDRLKDAFKPVDMTAFTKGFSKAEVRLAKFKTIARSQLDHISDGFSRIARAGAGMVGSIITKAAGGFLKFFKNGKEGTKGLAEGFSNVTSIVERLDKLIGLSRIQTFVQGAIFEKLGGIAEKVAHIGNLGMNLTTGFEAQMQQMSVAARKSAANFGVTGKALDQMTGAAAGMAKGMNISTETTTDALYSFSKAQKEFTAVGIDSALTLAKFSDLTGISATTMRESLLKARKELGFSDKEIQLVTGSFLSMGKAIGNVPGALADMPEVLKMMGELKSWGVTDTKVLSAFAAQTAALARGFKETGKGADEARQLSLTLTKAIIDSKANISRMFAGTADDLSEFTQNLGISVGDISEAFDLMKKGPEGMMQGLAKMVLQLKKQGKDVSGPLTFLHARLEQAIGPEASAQMTTFLQSATEETLSMMTATKTTSESLGKFAKEGWRSTKTLQEAWEDTKNSFISNFRQIARKEAVDFVRDTGKEFNKFNGQLHDIVKKGGPLAAVVTKLSEMHQLGVTALIPKTLRPMAALFGTIADQLLPMAAQLGALGFRFRMLTSPVGLLVIGIGAIVGWFIKLRSEGKSTTEALKRITDVFDNFTDSIVNPGKGGKGGIGGFLGKFFSRERIRSAINAIKENLFEVPKVIFAIISGKDPHAQTFVGKLARDVGLLLRFAVRALVAEARQFNFGALLGAVWGGLQKVISGLGDLLMGPTGILAVFIDNVPMLVAFIGKVLLSVLGGAVDFAAKFAPMLVDRLFDLITVIFDGISNKQGDNPLGLFLLQLISSLGEDISKLGAGILDIIDKAFKWLSNADISGLIGSLGGLLSTAFNTAIDAVVPLITKLVDRLPGYIDIVTAKILEVVKGLPGQLVDLATKTYDKIKEKLPGLVTSIISFLFSAGFKVIKFIFYDALLELPGLLMGAGELFYRGFKFLFWDTPIAVLQGLWGWIKNFLPELINTFKIWWNEKVAKIFTKQFWVDLWTGIKQYLIDAWEEIKKFAESAWNGFKSMFTGEFWINLWNNLKKKAGEVIGWLGSKLENLFKNTGNVSISVKGGAVSHEDYIKLVKEQKLAVGATVEAKDEFNNLRAAWKVTEKDVAEAMGQATDDLSTASQKMADNLSKAGDATVQTSKDTAGTFTDLAKNIDTAATSAVDLKQNFNVSPKVLETIGKTLPKTYTTALDSIWKYTNQVFVPKELGEFDSLVKQIAEKLKTAFLSILDATELTFNAIAAEISEALSALKGVEAQLETVRQAKASARAEVALEPYKPPPGVDASDSRLVAELEAINRPDWYHNSAEGYLIQIAQGIAALRVSGIPTASKGTPIGETKKSVEKVLKGAGPK